MSGVQIKEKINKIKEKKEEICFNHKGITQIKNTMIYEAQKNKNKCLSLMLMMGLLYALSFLLSNLRNDRGGVITNPGDYFASFLSLIDMIILIIAVSYAGSIIVEDFEKQTGNLIFPKITKDRLLFGRFLIRYIYGALNILFFYILVIITTASKYDESLPIEIFNSYLWAILYLFALMSFATLFSSIMKKTSTSIITTIIIVMMVFSIATVILQFTGSEVEPLFLITYYANIISSSLNMPTERFAESSFGGPPGATDNTIFAWSTPSFAGALVGMLIYSGICIIIAYYLFKRRQNSD